MTVFILNSKNKSWVILEKIKDVHSDCCVAILLETHCTPPGNQKDDFELKNLVKEGEAKANSNAKKIRQKLFLTELTNFLIFIKA